MSKPGSPYTPGPPACEICHEPISPRQPHIEHKTTQARICQACQGVIVLHSPKDFCKRD